LAKAFIADKTTETGLVGIDGAAGWVLLTACPKLSPHLIIIQLKEYFNITKLYQVLSFTRTATSH
jgi:hypothetical protein